MNTYGLTKEEYISLLKEFEDTYVMLLALPKLPDYYCEMTFSISNKKLLQTNIFRKVVL